MTGRSIIGLAAIVYLVVLGCVLVPSDAPGKKNGSANGEASQAKTVSARDGKPLADALPYRGAAMQIQRVDWMDKYKASVDEIAAIGCDTVSFVLDARQEHAESSKIYLDVRMSPTPDALSDLIQHAKKKGLRVIIMPVVLLDDPRGNDWRGVIRPPSWYDWFESYRAMLTHFAWIAEQNKVDVLSVGSELVSSEKEKSEWVKTIRHVRGIFHGQLTYSANWDHYSSIPFWKELDLMGMNSYYTLGENRKVAVNEIIERWREIQKDLLAFQRKIERPILFLEIGWCSLSNAADEPWDYTKTELDADPELQRKLYEGFFRSWYKEPGLGGFMVWEWTPGDVADDDKGYTPEGKPAQKVLEEWLAKPWKPGAQQAEKAAAPTAG